MEKGEYKTGQLLGIVEKRGKLIREYVAGFFGDEPIIKQRLLTPQEARRYREDMARGKKEGKSGAEAAKAAGMARPGAGLAGRPGLKKKPEEPGAPVRKRPIGTAQSEGKPAAEESEGVPSRIRPREEQAQKPAVAQPSYQTQSGNVNDAFVRSLIDSEPDKPNYNPANLQKAIDTINRIGSPEMKIFRLGVKAGESEGAFYTQKEYLAREIMGLPMWKAKPEEPASQDQTEEKNAIVVAEKPAEDQPADAAEADGSENEETEAAIVE